MNGFIIREALWPDMSWHTAEADSRESNIINRRDIIAGLGGGFFVSMAGCMGDDEIDNPNENGNNSNSSDSSNNGEIVDQTFVKPINEDLSTQVNFNPYNLTLFGQTAFASVDLAALNRETTEFEPHAILEDWEVNDSHMDVFIDDRWTWQNGEPITAEDLITKWRLDYHMLGESLMWSLSESVEVVDDLTARINYSEEVNENVLLPAVLRTTLDTPRFVFGEFLEQMEDAQGDMSVPEARETGDHQQLQEELRNFDWSTGGDEEVVGNGPFRPVEVRGGEFIFELYEDHPATVLNDGDINFREVRLIQADPTNPELWINEEVDGREIGWPGADQVPDDVADRYVTNDLAAMQTQVAILPHDHELLGLRNVRRAISFVCNREEISQYYTDNNPFEPMEQTPTSAGLVGYIDSNPDETWLGDQQDDYIDYSYNEEEAISLLEEEGFTREDGAWYTPDGDRWSINAEAPEPYQEWVQVFVDQLISFGIDVELSIASTTVNTNNINSGEFELTFDLYGTTDQYPYFTYDSVFNSSYSANNLTPEEPVEIPFPIGDLDGETEEFSFNDTLNELAQTMDSERQEQLIRELAWAWNVSQPMIQLLDRGLVEAVKGEPVWNLPDEDHDVWSLHRFAVEWMFPTGVISAAEGN